MKIRFTGICLIIFILAGTTIAQTGKITGKVLDSDSGEPVIGADVYLIPGNDPYVVSRKYKSKTNVDGKYMILNVVPGTYKIVAKTMGYDSVALDLTVAKDELKTFDIQMPGWITHHKKLAKKDIEKGIVKFQIEGMIVWNSCVPMAVHDSLCAEYGFGFSYDCSIDTWGGNDAYNETIEEYLKERNGENWRDEFNEKSFQLDEKYSCNAYSRIKGIMLNADNKQPLVRVSILLTPVKNILYSWDYDQEFSGVNGKYFFTSVKPGNYKLTISLAGYRDLEEDVTLKSGETHELNFDLIKE